MAARSPTPMSSRLRSSWSPSPFVVQPARQIIVIVQYVFMGVPFCSVSENRSEKKVVTERLGGPGRSWSAITVGSARRRDLDQVKPWRRAGRVGRWRGHRAGDLLEQGDQLVARHRGELGEQA